jgi:hypothetical protein
MEINGHEVLFDEASHRYTVDGEVWPSATQALTLVGANGPPPADAAYYYLAGQRGSYVHHACHLDDAGKLRWETLDPVLEPHVRGWQQLKTKHEIQVLSTEQMVLIPHLKIVGTLDHTVVCRDPLGRPTRAVLDLKQQAKIEEPDYFGLQLQFYALGLPGEWARVVAWLRKDRHEKPAPKLIWYDDQTDVVTCTAIADYAWWLIRHGVPIPQ